MFARASAWASNFSEPLLAVRPYLDTANWPEDSRFTVREAPVVTSKSTDDFSDSFYYRAIRTRMGEALRNRSLPTEPLSERLIELLHALDQPKEKAAGPPERKHEK
jgi:hypothetical protein